MTEADLARIETTLGLKLPAEYRAFALGLPSDPHNEEGGFDWWEFYNVDEIIEENERLRSGRCVDDWKPHLFCLGSFEGGQWFIDVTDIGKGVFFNDTSGVEGEPYYVAEDYSACWECSFDDFIIRNVSNAPKGILDAMFMGKVDDSIKLRTWDVLSLESAEEQIRGLNDYDYAEIGIRINLRSPPEFLSGGLTIAGGFGGYTIEAAIGDDAFRYGDADASSEAIDAGFDGDPPVPRNNVCWDIDIVIEILHHFEATGELLSTVPWQRVVEERED